MNSGKTIFAQLMDVIPKYEFRKIVQRHNGNHRVRKLSCWDQFISMCFGQLTFRHSLRDVTTTLNALGGKRYRMGFRNKVPLSGQFVIRARKSLKFYQKISTPVDSVSDLQCDQVIRLASVTLKMIIRSHSTGVNLHTMMQVLSVALLENIAHIMI